MRILHVLPSLSPGGMERLVIQLAADATGHGDSVVVASEPRGLGGQGPRGRRRACRPASHLTRNCSQHGDGPQRLAWLSCIRHVRPHVVHAHNVRATAMARLALVATRDRTVLMPTLHGVAPGDYARQAGSFGALPTG